VLEVLQIQNDFSAQYLKIVQMHYAALKLKHSRNDASVPHSKKQTSSITLEHCFWRLVLIRQLPAAHIKGTL